jgi:glycosyltransferase involved in cell wall biosynthesis
MIDNPPLVSAIIPVYNGERYLAQAIESVLAQTYRLIELIVVDDGSVDSSADIAKSYQEVQSIHQTNQGHGAAKNAGIQAAQGEFLAFLDVDDLWEPNKLDLQVGHLIKHPHIGYTICKARTFLEHGTDLPSWLGRDQLEEASPLYVPSALVVRKTVIEEIGDFDTTYRHANDCDWFFRAKDADFTMAIVPHVLLHRRIHSSNMSYETPAMASEMLRALKSSIARKQKRNDAK